MIKRTVFSLALIFLLSISVTLFQSCPISGGRKEDTIVQKPSWAVNKAGAISVEILNLDPRIEYNPSEGFSNEYSIVCRSSIYTGERRTYSVNYRILSSTMIGDTRGSCIIEEAEYDIVKGTIYPTEKDAGTYRFVIQRGLEAIQSASIVVEYNISNLFTKISIPITVRRPASGSTSTLQVPIYYTASPIVPRSDRTNVDVTSRSVTFYIDIIDAVGCFRGYKKPPQLRVGNNIRITATAAGTTPIDLSCTPTTISTLPATIRCSMDLSKNKNLYDLFSSETGLYIEIDISMHYDCSMTQTYNVQVIKQI